MPDNQTIDPYGVTTTINGETIVLTGMVESEAEMGRVTIEAIQAHPGFELDNRIEICGVFVPASWDFE